MTIKHHAFDGRPEVVWNDLLYFSLTTITTLGYGDVSPVSAVARIWASFEAATGSLYLAVLIDLHSRRVVGWSIDQRMSKALVVRALLMAVNLRKPAAGLIHHSDRGSQYASHDYQELLRQHQMICSMSRKGNCWDNAPVERFFGSLKREWTDHRLYPTRHDAMADVREYVAVYYNSRRLHSTLGHKTPLDYEKTLNTVSGIC